MCKWFLFYYFFFLFWKLNFKSWNVCIVWKCQKSGKLCSLCSNKWCRILSLSGFNSDFLSLSALSELESIIWWWTLMIFFFLWFLAISKASTIELINPTTTWIPSGEWSLKMDPRKILPYQFQWKWVNCLKLWVVL